ncbi:flavodoxin family protein [Campylobacter geochelonis]|uniref:Flavodoxin family protein n=1 Tax=Campylobacter geochelonis TaxID=1780362 RepID=A0A128EA20_9BACT|nr:flavodoxin family protein [Campylobacter geochelonis]QKF72082.1 flavodoxin (Flavodoxin_3 domain) [Campylobacter geochelonis]CZE45866.1 flavodoxin family protein [Campylobacter geochelonis]CZE46771.1 flavodoxin family protein [Campylobacter geochelonis]CZE49829.1 flavodoxin family protein [Campylobacter geochelonis]
MKNLVLYDSLTGNTKKVANAIASSLNCDIKGIDEKLNLDDYERVIFGFFVDKGLMSQKAKDIAIKIKDKKVGIFFTLGAEPNSQHADKCKARARDFFEKNSNLVEEIFCSQGAIDPKLIEKMKQIAQNSGQTIEPKREARWSEAASHPDENDLKNAVKAFAKFR